MRTATGDLPARRGRMAKATQFAAAAHDVLDLADEAADVADAFVTLAVHAASPRPMSCAACASAATPDLRTTRTPSRS